MIKHVPKNPISDNVWRKSEWEWMVIGMYCLCALCRFCTLALVISVDWNTPLIVLYESNPYPQKVFIWIWSIISFQRCNLKESPLSKSFILWTNVWFVKDSEAKNMLIKTNGVINFRLIFLNENKCYTKSLHEALL